MSIPNLKLIAARAAIAKRPKSKATALSWYLKDHVGLLHNPTTFELRAELALALKEVKGRNAPAIVRICRDCMGDGVDGNCRNLIRNCEITDCMLFHVRPYQSKSKVSLKNAAPRAFRGLNASEATERVTSTNSPSIKPLLEHIMTDCFNVEM